MIGKWWIHITIFFIEERNASCQDDDGDFDPLKENEDEANNEEEEPEASSQVLEWESMLGWDVECPVDVEAPSTSDALKDADQEEQVAAQVVVDNIEEHEIPMS